LKENGILDGSHINIDRGLHEMRLLFILGTRPECIKLAPLIKEFQREGNFVVKVCSTNQHNEMLNQVLNFFKIHPDFCLNIFKSNQSLFYVTYSILKKIEPVFNKFKPDMIFIQGDTTTAFVGALSGFYKKIKIAHIEAGLRSYNKYSPFPEEINRVLISHLADYHFAPTLRAKENLIKEGIKDNIFVVGNTVIDALLLSLEIIKEQGEEKYYNLFNFIDFSKKIILVTQHRRENFGFKLKNICYSLKEIAQIFQDVEIVFPVHLNPNVRQVVYEILKDQDRIHLIEPLNYSELIWLMSKSYLIITDSGGIQEEAPSLRKPVLITREVTERVEVVEQGSAILVGTDSEKIVSTAAKLLSNEHEYKKMTSNMKNPYGDGTTSKKILEIIKSLEIKT